MLKKIFSLLLIAFIVIQFFMPAKNVDTSAAATANDITKLYTVPENVMTVLKTSCYDCHSNNTAYPWYNNIQPIAWWLKHHVDEGKREINFNEFASYPIRRQYKKLEEIDEQVKEGEMPLSSYTIVHKDAKLSSDQRTLVMNWVEGIRKEIAAKYPADSLIKK